MKDTPLSERVHIVLYGLRNSGKSSLLNNLFRQSVSIVSPVAGTTTDPVTKAMEMEGLGPVALTDTAGFDDCHDDLGRMRVEKSASRLETADMVVLVSPGDRPFSSEESAFLERSEKGLSRPLILAETFGDRPQHISRKDLFASLPRVRIDNLSGSGVEELHRLFVSLADHIERERPPLEGLVSPGDRVMLVTPVDSSAPKGRLILPQVEVLRDVLDKDCTALVTKEFQLPQAYAGLTKPPELVITDSQAFGYIKDLLPPKQPLTSFSILFARKKGDLSYFTESLKALKNFPPGQKVLVLEACNHHRMDDDIGTVKIPRIFREKVQEDTRFELTQILPAEEKLQEYALVISCAGCMATRNVMMRNLAVLRRLSIPALNYGMFFAWANGLFPRALLPIPSAALFLRNEA